MTSAKPPLKPEASDLLMHCCAEAGRLSAEFGGMSPVTSAGHGWVYARSGWTASWTWLVPDEKHPELKHNRGFRLSLTSRSTDVQVWGEDGHLQFTSRANNGVIRNNVLTGLLDWAFNTGPVKLDA